MKKIPHLLLLIFTFFPCFCWAQSTDSLKRHFIVAVDVAYTDWQCRPFIRSAHAKDCIFQLLEANGFDENDYLSFVSYALNLSHPDFSTFVSVASDAYRNPVQWRQYPSASIAQKELEENWGDIVIDHHLKYINYASTGSMQSLAKEYVLQAVSAKQSAKRCDETLLLMLTDEVVNSVNKDYVSEWREVSGYSTTFENLKDSVFSFIKDSNANYQFVRTKIKNVKGLKYNDRSGILTDELPFCSYSSLKVVPYKVQPVLIPSIQAITNIPSSLPIKRVRGGYKLNLEVSMLHDKFAMKSLDLVLQNSRLSIANGEELFISRDQLSDGDFIALELEVNYLDGIYNGISMSPMNPRYKDGMTLKTKFRLQQDTKIMGMLPLHDWFWWFFPNDVQMAVATWNLIIVLAFIVMICYVAFRIFRRITLFVPSNSDITLKKN